MRDNGNFYGILTVLAVISLCAAVGAAPIRKGALKNAPARKTVRTTPAPSASVSAYRRDPYQGAIAIEAESGRVLFADRIHETGCPASVTKLMTLLLVLEDIKAGKYTLKDRATASVRATLQEPSAVGIRAGQSMTIDDLLHALMLKSANDGAVVLAEHSAWKRRGGTRVPPPEVFKSGELFDAFVARMNRRAQELGMKRTRYVSPNGLPPPRGSKRGFDVSTAEDLAKLGRLMSMMPEVIAYTRQVRRTVTDGSGKPLTVQNHNNILWKAPYRVAEADGLKTGYNDRGGSSIVLTGARDGRRVVIVVLGSARATLRDEIAARLLRDALGAIAGW